MTQAIAHLDILGVHFAFWDASQHMFVFSPRISTPGKAQVTLLSVGVLCWAGGSLSETAAMANSARSGGTECCHLQHHAAARTLVHCSCS